MADFLFYLNKQGARGQKGEQGEQGFSPIITVGTNTLSEYTLLIQTQDSSFETVNLREHKEDLGGTYIRYNRNTGVMYAGDVDNATTEGLGVVRFATDAEAQAGSEETVITPAQVDSKIEELDNEIQTNLLNYVQRSELSAYALRTDLNNYVPISQLSSLVDLTSYQNISGQKNFQVIHATSIQTDRLSSTDGLSLIRKFNNTVRVGSQSSNDNLILYSPQRSITVEKSSGSYTVIDEENLSSYLPIATASDVGVVKPDGTTITIDNDGTLHGSSTYTLPTASTTTLGGVKVDGTTITIDSNGVISSQGGGSTYTAGNGIDITNDVISIDTSVVAEKTDIPTVPTNISAFTNDSGYITSSSLSNYMDLSSNQTSTGVKTFSSGIITRTIYSHNNSPILADGSNGETFVGGTGANGIVVLRSANRGVRIDRNGGSYTNVDTGNLDTELSNSTYLTQALNSAKKNIGEIVASSIPLTDAGLHLLDGSVIDGSGIYADFVTYISNLDTTANYFCTETEWQASVTQYGVCGKFVYDSTNNTVRLPKITGIIEGTTDVSALGNLIEAGLPNITGQVYAGGAYGSSLFTSSSGFIQNGSNDGWRTMTQQSTVSGASDTITFNASNSSSIYGNSTTVQPQTIQVMYYIVVANVTKTEIEVDIDEIATDLNNKVDASELTDITELYPTLGGLAMPSNVYTNLTLGSSGSTYSAPANGYFAISRVSGGNNQWINIKKSNDMILSQQLYNGTIRVLCPVLKGESVTITYTASGNLDYFRFYYAVGSESEA